MVLIDVSLNILTFQLDSKSTSRFYCSHFLAMLPHELRIRVILVLVEWNGIFPVREIVKNDTRASQVYIVIRKISGTYHQYRGEKTAVSANAKKVKK